MAPDGGKGHAARAHTQAPRPRRALLLGAALLHLAAAAVLLPPLAARLHAPLPRASAAGAAGVMTSAAQATRRGGGAIRAAATLRVPFYMYEDKSMTLAAAARCKGWGTGIRFAGTDIAFFEVMENHPWRVRDPEAARVFVIPIPVASSFMHSNSSCAGAHVDRMASAFRSLFAHPVYRRHNASHYLHCHFWACLNAWAWDSPKYQVVPRELYNEGNLSNIMLGRYERYLTTAADCERYGATFGICSPESVVKRYKTTGLYRRRWELSRCAIAVPYRADPALRRLAPSYDEWRRRNNTVFYQTRTQPSGWGATAARHAPVTSAFAKLPGANVGFGLPPAEWAAAFESSKFCLVIRGDTPTSHALANAIKVGCVPVIISDTLSLVGAPFPAQLPWSLFTVSLPEGAFVADPLAIARFIWQLPPAHAESLVWHLVNVAHPALLYEPGGAVGDHILRQLALECLDG